MTLQLRPHQLEAQAAVLDALDRGIGKQLACLPTGTGKTLLACSLATKFHRALFLVHREELVCQTLDTWAKVSDAPAGLIWGESHELDRPFVVGMIPTIYRRLERIPPDAFDLVILDECHHAAADTWRKVAEHFRPRLRLGLSATPERSDGKPLNDLFEAVTFSMGLSDAIRSGMLVKPSALQIQTKTNLDGVRVVAGDFKADELEAAIDIPARNQLIAETILEHAGGRKSLIFAAGIEHAQNLAGSLQDVGIRADWISGADPARSSKLEAFKAGEIEALSNAMLLTEGFDDPSVGAVAFARPVRSRPLYAQILGRGLRLHEGKTDCIVLDFQDVCRKHSLLSAWKFFGFPAPASDKPEDVFSRPRVKVQEAVERLASMGISACQEKLMAVISAFDLMAPPAFQSFRDGTAPWELQPASDKQKALLEAGGFDPEGWTKGQAAQVIGSMPPSPRQILLLLAKGFDVLTHTWTRDQAAKALEDGGKPDWRIVNQALPRAWKRLQA